MHKYNNLDKEGKWGLKGLLKRVKEGANIITVGDKCKRFLSCL